MAASIRLFRFIGTHPSVSVTIETNDVITVDDVPETNKVNDDGKIVGKIPAHSHVTWAVQNGGTVAMDFWESKAIVLAKMAA